MRIIGRLNATLFALLVVSGCAGGPDLSSRGAPDWVLAPPASGGQSEVFVVSGSGGSAASAEEAAGYTLLNQINQALGVAITVETSATARSSLDSFEVDLVQQVTQRGTGRIQGLRVADRYISEQGGAFVVYLLGEYERGAFEAERARRESLLRQEEMLLVGPENEGDTLVSSGRLTQGLVAYTQAAVAASESGLPQAPVVLQRSLQKAGEVSGRMQLETVRGPSTVDLGDEEAPAIEFLLSDDRGRPVSGAGIEISYVEARGTRDVVRTSITITGGEGRAFFQHPAPRRVGEFTVTARLQVESALTLLRGLPGEYREQVAAITNALVNVRAMHRFVALSQARTVPTAILVQDLDAAGQRMPADRTSEGMTEALSAAGFILRAVELEASVSELSRSELERRVRTQSGGEVTRLVYGTAEIVESRNDDGVLIKVSGSITAVDLESGNLLYQTSGVKNARSQTAERAISTAFSELGRQLGEDLAANLP